jgi:hypothetical protein
MSLVVEGVAVEDGEIKLGRTADGAYGSRALLRLRSDRVQPHHGVRVGLGAKLDRHVNAGASHWQNSRRPSYPKSDTVDRPDPAIGTCCTTLASLFSQNLRREVGQPPGVKLI